MWIKQVKKRNSKDGKVFCQYQLTRTTRANKKTKQISILYLGSNPLLAEPNNRKIVAKLLQSHITEVPFVNDLFSSIPEGLIKLAADYYEKYLLKYPLEEGKKDIAWIDPKKEIQYEEIQLDSTQSYDSKEIGSEWLCYQILNKLEIDQFLLEKGWDRKAIEDAKISIISRAILAGSEYKTAQWLRENSGLLELFDQKDRAITHHNLYKAANNLDGVKEQLESYLYEKTKEIFNLEDSILIYDLTNTYFESPKRQSQLAAYGRSKEKRNDCKQVVLGAVINKSGFLNHSKIYEGNMSDPATLSEVIEAMEQKTGSNNKEKILVLDAGIATEKNLAMLRKKQMKYVCVSRRQLKDYEAIQKEDLVVIRDSRDNKIELKLLKEQEGDEKWLYVKSEEKEKKESSMANKLHQRFTDQLQAVVDGLSKKGGTKKIEKVWERIGRIKERNKRVHGKYELKVSERDGNATAISWERKPEQTNSKNGVYFLRTNYDVKQEQEMWQIYNLIREVEATFRCLKTDLNLRPIFHQKDQYIKAHLNLGLIAYQLVATIRHMLKAQNINYSWSTIVRIMNTQKIVSIEQKAKTKTIRIRCCDRPNQKVAKIYKAVGVNSRPRKPQKYVVYH